MPFDPGQQLTPEALIADGWITAGGPSGCNCCQSGTVPPICCPDYLCHGICVTLGGSVDIAFPAPPDTYPITSIETTVYYGPNQGIYFEEVELLDAGPPEVWVKKIIGLFIACDGNQFELVGGVEITVLSVNGLGTPTYVKVGHDLTRSIGNCANIDNVLEDDSFTGGGATATVHGLYSLLSGPCDVGDPCCKIACTNGSSWFCAPTVPVNAVFGTFSGGGGTISFTNTSITIQEKCAIWVYRITATTGDSGLAIVINCDGTVYGTVQYSADGFGNPLTQLEQVGTVTTVNSCSPVDVVVTFTSGPYSGQTLHITE